MIFETDGLATNDPDVPRLREMRETLAAQVADGTLSQFQANAILGQFADALAGRKPVGRRQFLKVR